MCECHQIGGRFVAEDPDCPIHGRGAQEREETLRSDAHQAMLYRQLRDIHDGVDTLMHVRGMDGNPIGVGGLDAAIERVMAERSCGLA